MANYVNDNPYQTTDDLLKRINQLVATNWWNRFFRSYSKDGDADDKAFAYALTQIRKNEAVYDPVINRKNTHSQIYKNLIQKISNSNDNAVKTVLDALTKYLSNSITWRDVETIATTNPTYTENPDLKSFFATTKNLIEPSNMEKIKSTLITQITDYITHPDHQGKKHTGKKAVMKAILHFLNNEEPYQNWTDVEKKIKDHELTYKSGFYSEVKQTVKKVRMIHDTLKDDALRDSSTESIPTFTPIAPFDIDKQYESQFGSSRSIIRKHTNAVRNCVNKYTKGEISWFGVTTAMHKNPEWDRTDSTIYTTATELIEYNEEVITVAEEMYQNLQSIDSKDSIARDNVTEELTNPLKEISALIQQAISLSMSQEIPQDLIDKVKNILSPLKEQKTSPNERQQVFRVSDDTASRVDVKTHFDTELARLQRIEDTFTRFIALVNNPEKPIDRSTNRTISI